MIARELLESEGSSIGGGIFWSSIGGGIVRDSIGGGRVRGLIWGGISWIMRSLSGGSIESRTVGIVRSLSNLRLCQRGMVRC